MIDNHLVASTTAVDMRRVKTQEDRRAISCFRQRFIFDHKMPPGVPTIVAVLEDVLLSVCPFLLLYLDRVFASPLCVALS